MALVLAALLIVGGLHLVYRRLDEVERAVHDFAFRWGFAATLAASLAQAAAQGGELGGALPLWPVALVAWQLALVVGWWRIR
ncbi:MAG TPA: hypothetical protein VMS86_16085 [Thermoanaerobaculia bacterium]|nr:hypothetical protein [Thermoanaerobaculia bacterium]